MTPEELAHWRYRHGAIERDLIDLRAEIDKTAQYQVESRIFWLYSQDDSVSPGRVEESFTRPNLWDDYLNRMRKKVQTNEYLLEEAYYKIELGETYARSSVEPVAEDSPSTVVGQ